MAVRVTNDMVVDGQLGKQDMRQIPYLKFGLEVHPNG